MLFGFCYVRLRVVVAIYFFTIPGISNNYVEPKLYLSRELNKDLGFIPLIQRRIDQNGVKQSLDEFSLQRKRTHVTLPHIETQIIKKSPRFQRAISEEYYSSITDNDFKVPENSEETNYDEIRQVLIKQKYLLRELLRLYTFEDENLMNNKSEFDFDRLLHNVRLGNLSSFKTPFPTTELTTKLSLTSTTTTRNTIQWTTIKTLIDETEIKQVLARDPYIQRILKLANARKRHSNPPVKRDRITKELTYITSKEAPQNGKNTSDSKDMEYTANGQYIYMKATDKTRHIPLKKEVRIHNNISVYRSKKFNIFTQDINNL